MSSSIGNGIDHSSPRNLELQQVVVPQTIRRDDRSHLWRVGQMRGSKSNRPRGCRAPARASQRRRGVARTVPDPVVDDRTAHFRIVVQLVPRVMRRGVEQPTRSRNTVRLSRPLIPPSSAVSALTVTSHHQSVGRAMLVAADHLRTVISCAHPWQPPVNTTARHRPMLHAAPIVRQTCAGERERHQATKVSRIGCSPTSLLHIVAPCQTTCRDALQSIQ